MISVILVMTTAIAMVMWIVIRLIIMLRNALHINAVLSALF